MRRHHIALLALASLFATGIAVAQPQPFIRQSTNPYYSQPISPWLNMLRGGSAAANYYNGVVPEFRQNTLNAQYGAQMQMLNQRLAAETEVPEVEELIPTLPGTGHGTQFMNASPYFALNPYLAQQTASPRRPQSQGRSRPGGR